MVICERLISKDYQKVYYLTKCKEKNIWWFFVPKEESEINYLFFNDDDAFFDLYTSLIKTRREVLPLFFVDGLGRKQSTLEWKTPPYHAQFTYSYKKMTEIAKERVKQGKQTQLRISD